MTVLQTLDVSVLTDVFTRFTDLVDQASGWAYAIIFLLAVVDAVLPVVPSETAVITGGVVASAGDLNLPLVILLAATGAFLGDNTAYLIGRRVGKRFQDRFMRSEKARRRIAWAERQLAERGGELIAIGRFIPGGRTAVTLTAGTVHYPWRRFAAFDAIAALVWGLYAALLGYFGGRAFEEQPWKGLLLALGIAFGVAVVVELVRAVLKRRKTRAVGPVATRSDA